jgi:hypothetical protein
MVHHEFVLHNTTVNSDFYCDILRCLRENFDEKCQNFGATTTDSFIITTLLPTLPWKPLNLWLKSNMVFVPHPPYSPDLAPCDFALFPKLKMKLKGRCFEKVSHIQRESQAVLNSIKEWLPRCFWTMEKKMGSLYMFQRWLFWRMWQPKLS